jgi:hypothetical protein
MISFFKKMYAPVYMVILVFSVIALRKIQLVGTGHLALTENEVQLLWSHLGTSILTTGFGTYITLTHGIVEGAPWYQHFVFLTFILGPTICWIFYTDFNQKEGLVYMVVIAMCGSYFFTGHWFNIVAMILTLAIGFTGLVVIGGFVLSSLWSAFLNIIQGRRS